VHRAPAPAGAGAPGTVTYSVQLQAWCVFLIAAHYLPVHRAAQLVESLTGARPSPEFVHALIARAAAAVAQANALIRALIVAARVVCADETPIRCGPGPKSRKRYLLVACTHLLTYDMVGDRSLAAFKSFVFPDLSGAVVVHDRYQNYDKFPGLAHQLCVAQYAEPGIMRNGAAGVARVACRGGDRSDAGAGRFCIITGSLGRRGRGRAGDTVRVLCWAGSSARVPVL
jgi:transposase